MARKVIRSVLLIAGVAILGVSFVLFYQSSLLVDGNVSEDTAFGQAVFHDVIVDLAENSQNGVPPRKLAGPLYIRSAFCTLLGFAVSTYAVWIMTRKTGRPDNESEHAVAPAQQHIPGED